MRLGQSPADPHLKSIIDLYINFWAVEAQAFSLFSPSSFFAMYSPPKTPSIQRSARDRLEEELRFAARAVS
jgi:syntaxin-binding protein 1